MYITQPALRDSINSLEAELEFPIFFRSNRGVSLTASGKAFVEDMEMILQIASNWSNTVTPSQEILKTENITIHLTISLSIADYIFKNVLLKLILNYPNLSFNLNYCSTPEIFHENKEKALSDILIVGSVDHKMEALLDYANVNNYDIELLISPSAGIIVNRNHPLAHKKNITLKDLKKI